MKFFCVHSMKIILVLSLLLMFIRCLLLVTRFLTSNIVAESCTNLTKLQSLKYDAWMVTVFYGILETIRFMEYVVIGVHLFNYWLNSQKQFQETIREVVEERKLFASMIIILWVCSVPGLIGLTVVVFQIKMETYHEHTEIKHKVCPNYIHVSKFYYAYCAFNFGRYLYAISVRLIMIIITTIIAWIWNSSFCRIKTFIDRNNQGNSSLSAKSLAEKIHNFLTIEYDKSGANVETLSKPFQYWFILPWIAYTFETSISVQNQLSPWEEDKSVFSIWAKLYTLFYSVTQFCLLLMQYLCALKINSHHQEYCRKTRSLQMKAFDDHQCENFMTDYKAAARKLQVEHQVHYNFSPMIWGIDVNISMDTPVYAILLLLNTFVALSQSLFDSNHISTYYL